MNGIDVSKHQGTIDWKKVKNAKIDFALVRAGWTLYEGGIAVDPYFKTNVENAIANKIAVGVYVYSYDRSVEAAKIAAKRLVELIKPYPLTFPVVFDMEYEDFNKTTGKGKRNTDICIAFLEEIEKAGYYAMLYCSTDFFHNYLELDRLDRYDKWCAQYGEKCSLRKPFGIWQHSSTGKVDGIGTNVDLNISYKDYPQLIKALKQTDPVKEKPVEKPPEKRWKIEFRQLQQAEDAQRIKSLLAAINLYSEVKSQAGETWVLSYSYAEARAKEVCGAVEVLADCVGKVSVL